jgi:hypothetical protein
MAEARTRPPVRRVAAEGGRAPALATAERGRGGGGPGRKGSSRPLSSVPFEEQLPWRGPRTSLGENAGAVFVVVNGVGGSNLSLRFETGETRV